MNNFHQNIFNFFRSPTKSNIESYDLQLEDNTTKALINILELSYNSDYKEFYFEFLKKVNVKKEELKNCKLQYSLEKSRTDAAIKTMAL